MTDPIPDTDVAIIGAGAAGTYCADRLAREAKLRVTVFEAENRVGGRLWSYDWAEAGTMVELGGEAFSPAHAIVSRLTRNLGLTVKAHDPFNTLNRYFLRDRLSRPEEIGLRQSYPGTGRASEDVKVGFFLPESYFVAPFGPPPPSGSVAGPPEALARHLLERFPPALAEAFDALCDAWMGRAAEIAGVDAQGRPNPLSADLVAEFVTPRIYKLMAVTIETIERAQFRSAVTLGAGSGTSMLPCDQLDLWSEVVTALGQEAYELFRAAGYDNTSAYCFNLVEMIENLLLGALLGMAAPNFWTVEGGFDRLPKALMDRAAASGAVLRQGHRLEGIRRDATSGLLTLSFMSDGGRATCTARQVVMAAPVVLFDEGIALDGFEPALTEAFRQRRKGIATVAAQKLFLVYPQPWWSAMTDLAKGADPLHGYATTDLPNRAIYYKGLTGDGTRALMTGALTDGHSSDFWSGFLSPDSTLFPGTPAADRKLVGAPVGMVGACHHLLFQMHRGALPGPIPDPELALYHEWRTRGGGWSAWKSGRRIHTEAAALRLPFGPASGGAGLMCCGDSVAERHGWVENTLESAEAMLREGFGLPPAAWMPGNEIF